MDRWRGNGQQMVLRLTLSSPRLSSGFIFPWKWFEKKKKISMSNDVYSNPFHNFKSWKELYLPTSHNKTEYTIGDIQKSQEIMIYEKVQDRSNSTYCSLPGSSIHGISQARILEWVAISSSRGSSQSRDQTCTFFTGRWIIFILFYHWGTREWYCVFTIFRILA